MATYYVDDGGNDTTGADWTNAYVSLQSLITAHALASGDVVYIGHNSVDATAYGANKTFVGPTSGLPVTIISATQGSSPPTYAASSTNQIDTAQAGAYSLTFDGSFALYGVRCKSGGSLTLGSDGDEYFFAKDASFYIANNSSLVVGGATGTRCILLNPTIDFSADTAFRNTPAVSLPTASTTEIYGGSFTGGSNRGNYTFIVGSAGAVLRVQGMDATTFTHGSWSGLVTNTAGLVQLAHCKTPSDTLLTGGLSASASRDISFVNVGATSRPWWLRNETSNGAAESSSGIYRSGGQSLSGQSTSILITTTAECGAPTPYYTPWIYGAVSNTGSKTFTVCLTNDTANFTDAECWLEVEFLGTAASPKSTLSDDRVADILGTAAAQTADTSTWNGSGPSFTYKQKVAVTATVNVAGPFRARVGFAVASMASSRKCYVDPLVTVA